METINYSTFRSRLASILDKVNEDHQPVLITRQNGKPAAEDAWEDYLYWQETDKRKLRRINALLKGIARSPFVGIGAPEPLKHQWSGYWSRRTDREHRLVYKVTDGSITVVQCRYHY